MRTSRIESRKLGSLVAEKLNKAKGKTALMIPRLGFSAYDRRGKVFYDPQADAAFIQSVCCSLDPRIEVLEMPCHINDEEFAEAAAQKLIQFMEWKM